MSYTREKIARAKALMRAGLGPKLLSRISDVPFNTLRKWDDEQRQASVQPDETAVEELKAILR